MPPKKEVKKQVQQPPKEQIPEIPAHQLQGYGRFSYPAGSEYVGEWKLFNGIKLKHGKGTLSIQKANLSQCGKQCFQGQWSEDKMCGEGVYYYYDGSVYKGCWKNNLHHGFGVYQFTNGTIYEGEWEDQLMHGTGFFIDHTGKKWGGEFRKGKFQSQNQAQLVKEKAVTLKKIQIKKQIDSTFTALLEAVAKSDKKSLKDNLSPFFATADNLKQFVKEPYSKFDQRAPQKWTEVITTAKSGVYNVIGSAQEATLITSDRIITPQLQGNGQFVEVQATKEDKVIKIGLSCAQGNKWIIVCALQQQRKK